MDNDEPTGISIQRYGPMNVREDEKVVFEIRSDTIVSQDTEIYLEVIETGEMIKGVKPSKATIPAGLDWTKLEIPLDDDLTIESESLIFAEVLPNPNYTRTPSYNNGLIVVHDNDLPVIAINSLGSIHEGDEALFQLTAVPTSHESLSIEINLMQEGDYLNSLTSQNVNIGAYQDSVQFRGTNSKRS